VRAVLQRVSSASVTVGERVAGTIGPGLLVLIGIEAGDGPDDRDYIVNKIRDVRIFPDAADKMNLSVADAGGGVLVVSQFTLYGDIRKGRRPSFDDAAPPDVARATYEAVVRELRSTGLVVATGEFQAMMQVELVNGRDPVSVARLAAYCGLGETVALVGSSGVGKSTLANTLKGSDSIATQQLFGSFLNRLSQTSTSSMPMR